MRSSLLLLCAAALLVSACSSSDDDSTEATSTVKEATDAAADTDTDNEADDAAADGAADTEADAEGSEDVREDGGTETFTIEVWADNWMAVYVDGVLVGEDSVSITTERSFNAETFSFDAAYPFTLAIEAKDFKETDSGLEYIGESNQQMGDGGIIAQVKDSSGSVVAVTTGDWKALVVHQAPLNKDCESSDDPDADCEFLISETPADWTSTDFDDSAWAAASVWDAAAVDPKIGYDEISWDGTAEFVWGTDLETDNTVLLRTTVSG